MAERDDTDDYRALLLAGTPLLDTRAPVEFARGAFPGAVNLPLMDDNERHLVGIRYKQAGQQAAIALGEELVADELKAQRLAAWQAFATAHPEGYLYCFRGGLRSQTVQRWLHEAGLEYPLVLGGYKAVRRYLVDELPHSLAAMRTVLVAGRTGSGKTRVIEALPDAVDLEGLAHHRGSTFGQLPEPQPSQIDFENAVGIALMRAQERGEHTLVLEDEGHLIGRCALPEALREVMTQAPLLVVEESVESRIAVVEEDYVIDLGRRYRERWGAEGTQLHQQYLLEGLDRIRKRLGGAAHVELRAEMEAAFTAQDRDNATSHHQGWIRHLLVKYYDPMYDYQLERRDGQIMARGSRQEITEQARTMLVAQ
ncbi:tRNA 2-selenouridine(34) synthase MnmH [Halieaceae bacterium IMCC14734]|uniref:tRNA 2-selenouridine synthase n=1 Tax=Candidatus Litorirhabdus singularis TaxID=2518993 RepID=A0ABT3TC60_9GAMM|nr:tRNA 2-selenouridine(34) synthase MnmH [Candidatus Litorirhabdus singularis]MCX2979867.1 tRNA 2-selenouridine(34) synthase MnmH [Candidatus Litorirhabdus singularis]